MQVLLRKLLTASACFVRGQICCQVDWTFYRRNGIWRDLERESIHAVASQVSVCTLYHSGCTRIFSMKLWHGCVWMEFFLVLQLERAWVLKFWLDFCSFVVPFGVHFVDVGLGDLGLWFADICAAYESRSTRPPQPFDSESIAQLVSRVALRPALRTALRTVRRLVLRLVLRLMLHARQSPRLLKIGK